DLDTAGRKRRQLPFPCFYVPPGQGQFRQVHSPRLHADHGVLVLARSQHALGDSSHPQVGLVRVNLHAIRFNGLDNRDLRRELAESAHRDVARYRLARGKALRFPRPFFAQLDHPGGKPGGIRVVRRRRRDRPHVYRDRPGLENLAAGDASFPQNPRLETCRRDRYLAARLREQRVDALYDVVALAVDQRFVVSFFPGDLDQHVHAADIRLEQSRLPGCCRPVNLHPVENLRLYIAVGVIDFRRNEDIGLARRGGALRRNRDLQRIASLGADGDGRDDEFARFLRHQHIAPRSAAADLAIDDHRVAEFTARQYVEVLLEAGCIRFRVDCRVDRHLERERFVQLDIAAVDRGDDRSGRRERHPRKQHDHRRQKACLYAAEAPTVHLLALFDCCHHGSISSSGHRLFPSWSVPCLWYW